MKRRLLILAAIATVIPLLWLTVLTTSASRTTADILDHILSSLEPGAPALHTSLTFTKTKGIPDDFENRTAQIAFKAPDQIAISAEVDGHTYHIARDGDHVWLHVPHQDMAIIGDNQTPRFATRPDSIQPVELPDFTLPVTRFQRAMLPAAIDAELTAPDTTTFSFKPSAQKRFDLPAHTFTLSWDPESHSPTSLTVADGNDLHVTVTLDTWSTTPTGTAPFTLTPDKTTKTEHVALAHLKRFTETTLANLDSKAPVLPPATGTRRLIATAGKGRLEDHEGTRVLFLEGTPEEMGKQHGELLKTEIRSVVDRILYGIGVGSSFGKGRWFFGEIEQAVARLSPHIHPRYLAEMDAIADAAGLDREELRLANFFPELFHCSGFALHGSATRDGELYHGRVLDYMRGVGLEENAVVMVIKPEGRNAWVNLSYAGFVGSITAMNEKHLAIGEMGGRGEGNWDGKPMAQLMREAMEDADTLEEIVAIFERGPRTCEYYYVVSDANSNTSVGLAATPEKLEIVKPGEPHPLLPTPSPDTVLMSAGSRYEELARRVSTQHGTFDATSARDLMTRPVCMNSNIQSVLFVPGALDFWVANADHQNPASHTRYTKYNLVELLAPAPKTASR